MRFRIFLCVFLIALASFCIGQNSSSYENIREIPGFDLTAIDKTAEPCQDFYQYACGNWMKTNTIPADKSRWGRFDQLQQHNYFVLRDILEGLQGPGQHSAIEQKVGDFYSSCMDE